MDFLDSLKNIKKEMQADCTTKKLNKNDEKAFKNACNTTQEIKIDKAMEEIFLKQERLQDEFSEFIKNSGIKKI
ncbi:hypothetical protein N4T57_03935 [Campylobacter hepaticus]|uniref:Uncharacterized protein n=1 Tax=Campylobacter hepaticus TaxID=1813019 RepID=A0A424Z1Y3_9BACT|nr:hypothetical protein [Campylobacter hepaticus]AXP08468.1 hypothetical protein A2J15_001780 [Campylobacter hepaticus]MCZ0772303.1 hypothetical protein [Campylobacter hepaticus]MCZ0773771.1 hypothetical protein [Campylobacter hepaticus]MCZ0775022.1 hypothetical protein [Campylobacter hepaticus]MDX2322891.1 hypothetical protein [Campylobacter hepaticus]